MALSVMLLTATLASLSATTQQVRTLDPTPLEAAAGQTGSRLAWTKFAGRLDGRVASAIVTAIAVETPGAEPKIMRGVRIELRFEGKRPRSCDLIYVEWSILCAKDDAAMYIEESRLVEVRNAILRCCATIHPGHGPGITTFSAGHDRGLLIGGYELFGRQPSDLAAMLDTAAELLKGAPR